MYFKTLCCLQLHTEADGVRQLEQVVVLLLYCGSEWLMPVINMILVGKLHQDNAVMIHVLIVLSALHKSKRPLTPTIVAHIDFSDCILQKNGLTTETRRLCVEVWFSACHRNVSILIRSDQIKGPACRISGQKCDIIFIILFLLVKNQLRLRIVLKPFTSPLPRSPP